MGTIRSVSDLVQAANDGDLALLEGGEEWFSEMVAATLMELLAVMAKEGVCLEVNSSGLRNDSRRSSTVRPFWNGRPISICTIHSGRTRTGWNVWERDTARRCRR